MRRTRGRRAVTADGSCRGAHLRDSVLPSVIAQSVVGDSRKYGWPGRVAQPIYTRQEARFSHGAPRSDAFAEAPEELMNVVRAIEQFWLGFAKIPGFA